MYRKKIGRVFRLVAEEYGVLEGARVGMKLLGLDTSLLDDEISKRREDDGGPGSGSRKRSEKNCSIDSNESGNEFVESEWIRKQGQFAGKINKAGSSAETKSQGEAKTPDKPDGNNHGNTTGKQVAKPDEKEYDNHNTKRVEPKEFVGKLAAAKATRDPGDAWRVDDSRSAEDFENEGIECYATDGGSTYGLKDGDIVSLCKNRNDPARGKDILADAVARGGNRLDSFDGNYKFYTKCGFDVVARVKFSKDKAVRPSGWREGIDNEEDILFMRYVGIGKTRFAANRQGMEEMRKAIPYATDYDTAQRILEESIAKGE